MPDSKADNAAGATPPSNATISTPMKNNALAADAHESVEPGHRDGADHRGHHQRGQPRRDMPLARETRDHPEARLAAGWVTM